MSHSPGFVVGRPPIPFGFVVPIFVECHDVEVAIDSSKQDEDTGLFEAIKDFDKVGGSLYDSPRPLWAPRSHQEVVDALSNALGPAARQVVETDQANREHYRTVWRVGGNTVVVLKNPVLIDGAVNTQAQLQ